MQYASAYHVRIEILVNICMCKYLVMDDKREKVMNVARTNIISW